MRKILSIYQFVQVLSLDVVAGAVIMCMFLCRILSVNYTGFELMTLGAAVWAIYTLDHLLDARSIDKEKLLTFRHKFHFAYQKSLMVLVGVNVLVGGYLALSFLDQKIVVAGLFTSLIVIGHFVLVRLLGKKVSPLVQKEFGVALGYAAGVMTIPVGKTGIDVLLVLNFLIVFCLAYINLIVFSVYDIHHDEKQGQTSIARSLDKSTLWKLVYVLIFIMLTLDVSMFFLGVRWYCAILYIIMCAILVQLLLKNKNTHYPSVLYRVIGDGVFILPIWIIII